MTAENLYRGPEGKPPGCEECHGDYNTPCGYVDANFYDSTDCKDCAGTGWNQRRHEPCYACDGHGYSGYSW